MAFEKYTCWLLSEMDEVIEIIDFCQVFFKKEETNNSFLIFFFFFDIFEFSFRNFICMLI